ncbi:MOSC domain-containing protein [Rhabdothermincola salaria]|uniref:MOSC domain-containing protein n=1 Tax=Rhabdothermincola salaria TaxID=2903142 RepID=UPI001E482DEE|nr:MOSC N-terminal beta barrel domain-containing protein [Rhabdothermincola salaria]MCD9624424.1 MOSC N-terminal beta barrel domain-containing protein [Rhabdothermincola salaria]
MTIGRVDELWRFPVKSLQGERVDSLSLAAGGIEGDRAWALVDGATGKLLSAKRHAALFHGRATTEGDQVVVVLPTGAEFVAGDPEGSRFASEWLDREVELRHVDPATEVAYEMTFDPPNDAAEMIDIPAPAGSFLDLAALHLVSTATLARARAEDPDLDWDVRRFRPNVVIELDEGADPGAAFTEDTWVGRQVEVDGATVAVRMATVRCAMPLRGQPGLEPQPGMYAVMEALHANHIGVYADTVRPGPIRVGGELALA